jgi:hypothetical protein
MDQNTATALGNDAKTDGGESGDGRRVQSTEFKNYYTGDPMDVYIILKRESRLNETRGITDCGNEIRFNGEEQDES